jgi:hypothetical protein
VNQTISGSSAFANLTKTESTNDATNKTLTVTAGTTQTINGTLSLNGLDADDRLAIVSSTGGSPGIFAFVGTSNFSTTGFLTVTDNTATDASTGVSLPLAPASSTDGGGTTGWFGAVISGTVYLDQGVTNVGAGKTIAVSVNGGATVTTVTTAGGAYSVSTTSLSAGDIVTVFIDNDAADGVVVFRASGAASESIDVYGNTLLIRSEDASPVTSDNLDTANNSGDTDIDAIFTLTGADVLQTISGKALYILAGDTYTPGANLVLGGDMLNFGTLDAAANNVSLTGDFLNSGTYTQTGLLTFNGTIVQDFDPGAAALTADIRNSNTTTVVTLINNPLDIGANDFTLDSLSTFNINGFNFHRYAFKRWSF